jgi:hypothetical protein
MTELSSNSCKNKPAVSSKACSAYPANVCAAGRDGKDDTILHSWTLRCICKQVGDNDAKSKYIGLYRACLLCQFSKGGGYAPGWEPHIDCLDWVCGIGTSGFFCRAEIAAAFNKGVNKCIQLESPNKGSNGGLNWPPTFVYCQNRRQYDLPRDRSV